MPQEYGAAQPLVGPYMDFMRRAQTGFSRQSPPRQDTSWHDDMTRRASDSFRQQAERDAAAKAAVVADAQPVKRVPKRTPARTPARPAAGKRR
jgi:hypothetical protein